MQLRDINIIKKIWQSGIFKKSLKDILGVYSNNAIFKGTFSHSPTDVKNKKEKYFRKLIMDIDSVEFGKIHLLLIVKM